MTFKDKLRQEHPELINDKFLGGCSDCPYTYGYEDNNGGPGDCNHKKLSCEECWNREMPDCEGEKVEHPNHYNRPGAMECIDEMQLAFGKEALKSFCLLNAWKYRYRAASKNGAEDLRKSDFYMRLYKSLGEASMTNAAKYKQVFGVEPRDDDGDYICPPHLGQQADCGDCRDCEKWWGEEYKEPEVDK